MLGSDYAPGLIDLVRNTLVEVGALRRPEATPKPEPEPSRCMWSSRIGYDCELPEGHNGNHVATDLDGKSKVGWNSSHRSAYRRESASHASPERCEGWVCVRCVGGMHGKCTERDCPCDCTAVIAARVCGSEVTTCAGIVREECPAPAWKDEDDKPLPEDLDIESAFPTRSGRHDLYQEAMRLVGARYSKAGLVSLVTWLLLRTEEAVILGDVFPQHEAERRAQLRRESEAKR